MFDCGNCKNQKLCKQKEQAKELQEDITQLKIKYRKFYGSIIDKCDYCIPERMEMNSPC